MKSLVFATKDVPDLSVRILKKQGHRVKQGQITAKEATGAAALLCLLTDRIDGKVMDAVGKQLKVISNMATGLDNIDLAAAKQRGIIVSNTPGVLTQAVAEHTVAMLLAIARRVAEGDRFVRAGKYKGWQPDLLLGTELQGKTLGVVGHGRIGCRVATILQKGFGMRTVYYDVAGPAVHELCGARKSSLQQLIREADAVSLHVPLLPSTRHLMGAKEFTAMKKTSYLVNTSRGPVVDERALVAALQRKEIAGAALDVFENEPKLAPGLAKLENAVLTPHIASASNEARIAMAELAARNIIVALENT